LGEAVSELRENKVLVRISRIAIRKKGIGAE